MKVEGWVVKKRDHKKVVFLDLRGYFPDEYLQVVVKEDCRDFEKAKRTSPETSVIVEGELVKSEKAPKGVELHAEKIEIVGKSEDYPLAKKEHSPETLMKYRHLAIRGKRYQQIFYVREKIIDYFREFMKKEGVHEVFPPIIVSNAVEGGSTLFEIKYFGGKAYLSQSAQLYLEALIFPLKKVYSLTPSFRAEKSRTKRHLAEYWHLEVELAFCRFDELVKFMERMIKHNITSLLDDDETREIIGKFREIDELEKARKVKYEVIPYRKAIEDLGLEFGDDIGADEEERLYKLYGKPFFLSYFPKEQKSFYFKINEKDPKTTYSADFLGKHGEIIGGGEREDDTEKLIQHLRDFGLKKEEYEWYLDLRRYGSVPHSGFGLGLDRYVRWILDLDHIKETLPFPRMARIKKFI